MSTLFLSRYSTPLVSLCRALPPPPHSLPFQVLHSTCLFVSPPNTLSPFSYPTPMSYCVSPLLLSSLTGTPPYLSSPSLALSYECPTPLVEFPSPLALFPYQVPLPNCLFVSHLTVFPLRYPTLMPYCVPPLLLSSRTSTPLYLSFCFPPSLSPLTGTHSTCLIVSFLPPSPLFLSSLTGTPP